jgi:hypothetical protein
LQGERTTIIVNTALDILLAAIWGHMNWLRAEFSKFNPLEYALEEDAGLFQIAVERTESVSGIVSVSILRGLNMVPVKPTIKLTLLILMAR